MRARQYAFRSGNGSALLLGAVHQEGRISVVTTAPNSTVAPIHHRMPLVLETHEVATWLGGQWASLADRSSIKLDASPQDDQPQAPVQPSLFD